MTMMWVLQAITPEAGSLAFLLGPASVKTVGRAPRADFVLDAPLVSRLHCRLEAGDHSLEVVDLSSTNGIYVNGKRVKRAPLSIGDTLRVGRVEFEIRRHE